MKRALLALVLAGCTIFSTAPPALAQPSTGPVSTPGPLVPDDPGPMGASAVETRDSCVVTTPPTAEVRADGHGRAQPAEPTSAPWSFPGGRESRWERRTVGTFQSCGGFTDTTSKTFRKPVRADAAASAPSTSAAEAARPPVDSPDGYRRSDR